MFRKKPLVLRAIQRLQSGECPWPGARTHTMPQRATSSGADHRGQGDRKPPSARQQDPDWHSALPGDSPRQCVGRDHPIDEYQSLSMSLTPQIEIREWLHNLPGRPGATLRLDRRSGRLPRPHREHRMFILGCRQESGAPTGRAGRRPRNRVNAFISSSE